MATGTAGTSARRNVTQQVGYLRFKVNYNDTGISTGIGKQFLPAGAIPIGTDVIVTTAFNAATTNVLTVGTNGTTASNLVASSDVTEGTPGVYPNLVPTTTAIGPLAADTQVWVKFTQTGTAATTGAAYVVVKYVCDNDLNVGV